MVTMRLTLTTFYWDRDGVVYRNAMCWEMVCKLESVPL